MNTTIQFMIRDNGMGIFKYRQLADYLAAWFLSIPITIAYFGLTSWAVPKLFVLSTPLFLFLMIVTNAVRCPIINPQWVLTSIRTLEIIPQQKVIFRVGVFPLCLQRSCSPLAIDRIVLMKQPHGKGMGYFYYWLTAGINLYALYILTKTNTRYYLATNEVKNGWLLDEGTKLATFLQVPFEENS